MLKKSVASRTSYGLFVINQVVLFKTVWKVVLRESVENEMFQEAGCSEESRRPVYRWLWNSRNTRHQKWKNKWVKTFNT